MKAITLRDDTYQRLVALKEDDDSFSDVIDRLASRKTCDIGKYAGALRDSKIFDDLQALTKEMRGSGPARAT